MTKITENHNDYKGGLSHIKDYGHNGWMGKVTIKEPCKVKNIQPNEPINFIFSFSEKEYGNSLTDGSPLEPSKWHVFADVPFKAGLEKITICEKEIFEECEQRYFRNMRFDHKLQRKYINNTLKKAIDIFEKFFSEQGTLFVPNENFHRDIYYLDDIEIEHAEDEITIDDLKIKKERLITLMNRELCDDDRYSTQGCDIFLDDQLHSSHWSENEAEHELMLLKKADYFRNEDFYHKYFDTSEEAEVYRKLVFVNSLLGEGPQAITSTDNIIRVAKFREERIRKYRKNIEKYLEPCDR